MVIGHYGEYQQVQNHIAEFNEYTAKFLSRIPFGAATYYTPFKPPLKVLENPENWGWINDADSEAFVFTTNLVALYATKHTVFAKYYKDLVARCHTLNQDIKKELEFRER